MTTVQVNTPSEVFLSLQIDPNDPVEIIDVDQLISRDACITEITAKIQNDIVTASGTSRRHPNDKADKEIGRMLSYSRALENLARKIRKRADGLIDQQAHNAAMRPIQLQKAAEWKANPIVKIPSTDHRVQVAAISLIRDGEGSWSLVNDQVSGSNA